jgi:hypothetical protein
MLLQWKIRRARTVEARNGRIVIADRFHRRSCLGNAGQRTQAQGHGKMQEQRPTETVQKLPFLEMHSSPEPAPKTISRIDLPEC